MKRKILSLITLILLVTCIYWQKQLKGEIASKGYVKVWESTIIIPTYEMFDDDPFPRFTEWKWNTPIYPYPMKNAASWIKRPKTYKAVYLENEYIKVVVLPELGGHLYQFYDKVNNRDIIYTNHVIKPGYFGIRGGWISGGFEFNFPKAHSTTTISPIDYATQRNFDGSASIIIGDLERMYRMRWQVRLTLFPGKAYLRQDTRLINRTPLPHRYHWWTIVAVRPNENTQVIFPAARIINHPQEYILTWPIWRGRDISRYKTLRHRFGGDWSILKPWDGFFAYYDHGIDAGLCHVGDKYSIGGTKYFSYSNTQSGRFHSAYIMSDEDGPYDEIDSSPFLTQKYHEIFNPYEMRYFHEYWYPINGLGGLKKANKDSAINIWRDKKFINIALNVNFKLINGYILVKAGKQTLLNDKISLSPGQVYRKKIPSQEGKISMVLIASDGKKIIEYEEISIDESELPLEGPIKQKEEDPKKMKIEEIYLAGIEALRMQNKVKAEKYFKAVLEKDSGHSLAHIQLGIIYLKNGIYQDAEKEFRASLKRNPYQGMPHYYLGVMYWMKGNFKKAKEEFSEATKYTDAYARAHHCLGQICLAFGDFAKAIKHFEKFLCKNKEFTQAWTFLALCYRKYGQLKKAKEIIDTVLRKEPINHFAAFEDYLLAKVLGKDIKKKLNTFMKLMRGNEHSYMELSWLYANCRLYQESIDVLRILIAKKKSLFPMVYYQLGYIYEQIKEVDKAAEFYKRGHSTKNWRYVFPNRLEEFHVLKRVLEFNTGDFLARYALGNLLASRYRYNEAIKQFIKCMKMAENIKEISAHHKICLAVASRNIGFLFWKVKKEYEQAISFYQKAIKLYPKHFTCYQELANIYKEMKRDEEAIKILERGLAKVDYAGELPQMLAGLYMAKHKYKKVIELGSKYKLDDWRKITMQRYVRTARLLKGKEYFRKKDFVKAIKEFEKATEVCPENLPIQGRLVREFAEILWWKGKAYKEIGELKKAKKAWAEVKLELDENPVSPLCFYKAKCLQAIGKTKEAEKILKEMLFFGKMYAEKYPFAKHQRERHIASYLYLQALAYEGMGMRKKAEEIYKKVLKLMPSHKDAREMLKEKALKY